MTTRVLCVYIHVFPKHFVIDELTPYTPGPVTGLSLHNTSVGGASVQSSDQLSTVEKLKVRGVITCVGGRG